MPFKIGHKSGMTGRKHSKETIEKMSIFTKARRIPEAQRIKMSIAKLGKKASVETRRKMSNARKGEKCHLWKGGITPINAKIRNGMEYRLWRVSVFQRDNYTCVWCGVRSGNGKTVVLNADHIKPFSLFPELRFAIDNGRTLCVDCHKKTDTFAAKLRWKNQ